MEHSKAYQEFYHYLNTTDVNVLREGLPQDILEHLHPEERHEVELSMIENLMVSFMHKLTTVDGIKALEESYHKEKKPSNVMFEEARYLFQHTRKEQFLEDILSYRNDNNSEFRVRVADSIGQLLPYMQLKQIQIAYQVLRQYIVTDEKDFIVNSSALVILDCFNRKGMSNEKGILQEPWRSLLISMRSKEVSVRIKALKEIESLVVKNNLNPNCVQLGE